MKGLQAIGIFIYAGGTLLTVLAVLGAITMARSVRRGRADRSFAVGVGVMAALLALAPAAMSVTLALEGDSNWAIVYWAALAAALFSSSAFALRCRPPT